MGERCESLHKNRGVRCVLPANHDGRHCSADGTVWVHAVGDPRDKSELASLRTKLAEAERQRDLAVAHDRQPYPTAAAYEAVCAARDKWHRRAETAEFARAVLAARVRNQRRELRRINQYLRTFWSGVRWSHARAATDGALDGGTRVVITGWKLKSNNVLPIHVWHERPSDPDELYEPCDVVVCDGREGKV